MINRKAWHLSVKNNRNILYLWLDCIIGLIIVANSKHIYITFQVPLPATAHNSDDPSNYTSKSMYNPINCDYSLNYWLHKCTSITASIFYSFYKRSDSDRVSYFGCLFATRHYTPLPIQFRPNRNRLPIRGVVAHHPSADTLTLHWGILRAPISKPILRWFSGVPMGP